MFTSKGEPAYNTIKDNSDTPHFNGFSNFAYESFEASTHFNYIFRKLLIRNKVRYSVKTDSNSIFVKILTRHHALIKRGFGKHAIICDYKRNLMPLVSS